jgi:hypothetical protein
MFRKFLIVAFFALSLGGCVSTSMQGYADRELPTRPVSHVVALVVAPTPLAESMQASLTSEASKRGVVLEDARALFPPTRQYSAAEINHTLIAHGIDGVLVINAGDSGIQQLYAGTIFSGTVTGNSLYGTATPVYHYQRQTDFAARLIDPASGRNLWVANGQVNSGGISRIDSYLFVGDGVSASNSAAAIFNDLQAKKIVAPSS